MGAQDECRLLTAYPVLQLKRHLFLNLSCQHQRNHFVVADERPKWVLEGCRFVFLYEEMANPGATVSGYQCQRKQPPSARSNKKDNAANAGRRANQMKQARTRFAMFSHVEGPEFRERVVALVGHFQDKSFPGDVAA